jgi:hypothetical protein
MSTATLASAWACTRPWCAQKRSSPELASSTRTYAWAPHRSQMSSAVSGLVGAIAPVNVAFPSRRASGFYIRLAPLCFLALPLSGTHTQALAFPTRRGVRHKRNAPRLTPPPSHRPLPLPCCRPDARCPCPAGRSGITGGTQAP